MNYSGHPGTVGGLAGYMRTRKARARYRRFYTPTEGCVERPLVPTPSVCSTDTPRCSKSRTADTVVARCNQIGGAL